MAPEGRRDAILDAAAALILKLGLRGTSMEAIARGAGIAKPTLYAHFPDKTAVFDALIARLVAGWREAFRAGLDGEGDVVQRVAAALAARHKAIHRLLAASPHAEEICGEHERGGPTIAAFEAEMANAIETALAQAGAARARPLTQLLLAAAEGIARKAQSPAEIGPALRLLAERLLRPELP